MKKLYRFLKNPRNILRRNMGLRGMGLLQSIAVVKSVGVLAAFTLAWKAVNYLTVRKAVSIAFENWRVLNFRQLGVLKILEIENCRNPGWNMHLSFLRVHPDWRNIAEDIVGKEIYFYLSRKPVTFQGEDEPKVSDYLRISIPL